MANHFQSVPRDRNAPNTRNVNFFDMPPKSFPSTYFTILNTHLIILDLYGRILEPHLTDFSQWKAEYDLIKERVGRHVNSWGPTIMAWNKARNKQTNWGVGVRKTKGFVHLTRDVICRLFSRVG